MVYIFLKSALLNLDKIIKVANGTLSPVGNSSAHLYPHNPLNQDTIMFGTRQAIHLQRYRISIYIYRITLKMKDNNCIELVSG